MGLETVEGEPLIEFENFTLDLPIYNSSSRSLKSHIAKLATGGLISKSQSSFINVTALDEISFSLASGDRLAILGHNGAGKSTLLRAMAGVYEPTRGQIKVSGKVGSLIDVGLGINVESTGRENVFVRLALMGYSRKYAASVMDEILEFSDLGDFFELPVRTYSTGMQMRLAFSISTIITPQILLMDEWLSVGDEGFREKAENRMNAIVSNTEILALATHSRALAEKLCTKAIWLEKGKLRLTGSVDEVCQQYFK